MARDGGDGGGWECFETSGHRCFGGEFTFFNEWWQGCQILTTESIPYMAY